MKTIGRSVVPLLVAAGVAGLTVAGWRSLWPPGPPGPPSLDCPAEVDLGPQEFKRVAVGRFRVANRGGSDLMLTQFGTSCSCAGVEVEQDGVAKRVEQLRVPPGGYADLSVRISIGLRPGMSQTVFVRFATNDPGQPDAGLKVVIPRITGGLSAEPAAVVFGDIPLGRPASKVVKLYSNGQATRHVHSVRSLQPERFDARLLPLTPGSESAGVVDRLVGLVEITPRVDRAQKLDGRVEVLLADEARTADQIAVLGEVVPVVVARPTTLVLPRHIGGRVAYSGQVALTSRDGAELTVTVESTPDGITAVVRPDLENPDQWLLDVTARPDGLAARTVAVRLRADLKPGGAVAVEVPVTLSAVDP